MAIVLADNTPRIEYTVAQGVTQTVFPIPFVFFNKEDSSNVDVKVFVDGVERTLGSISTTTFSITSGGNGAKGSLSTTVTGASGGSTVIVLRDTKIGRTTDFPSGGAFEVSKLNTELDTLVAIEGDFEDHVSRSIRLQDKDTAVSLALPLKADRLGKQLGFNATTGAVQMFTPESLAIASDSGSSSVDLTSNTFTFTGGEGIDTSISNQTLTITGELASTSNKGVASFNSTNFTVSSGAVTANDITLASDSGSATNTLGETFTLSGGTGLNTSATGSTVTMNVDAAQTGITSLLATDIKIGEDDQTKIDFETADQINFYANNVNVVQLSNANSGDAVFTVPTSDKDFVIKGNDGGSTITALTIDMSNSGDASFNNNVTVGGNLTVNGSSTTVNTATLTVEDPLISLASGNNSADSVDVGFYGLYDTTGSQDLYAGLFRDASDSGKFKLFKDLQVEPTTTVNTSGTGYAVGTLVANLEGNVNGTLDNLDSTQFLRSDTDDTLTATLTTVTQYQGSTALPSIIVKGGGPNFIRFIDGDNVSNLTNGVDLAYRTGPNDLFIEKSDNNNKIAEFGGDDGHAALYFNNSKKLETTSGGIEITGTVTDDGATHDGDVTFTGTNGNIVFDKSDDSLKFADNVKARFGNDNDGYVQHTGSIFQVISDVGSLNIKTTANDSDVILQSDDGSGGTTDYLRADGSEGSVKLYHYGTEKIKTTSTGATVSGDLTLTKSSGDTKLFIESDSDNDAEADNAFIVFKIDGGFETSAIWTGNFGGANDNSLNLTNAGQFSRGISFGTTATNNGWETATERMRIARAGDITFFGANYNAVWDNANSLLEFKDNAKATFGDDSDLRISHDGSNSFITEAGTGSLYIGGNSLVQIHKAGTSEIMINANADSSVELYHDNVKRFETDAFGALVTGRLKTTQNIDIENTSGYGRIEIGGASGAFIDLKSPFSDDFDHRIITAGSGAPTLQVQSDDLHLLNKAGTEFYLDATVNGAVNLYYDNVKKFETTSDGATVTGGLTVVGGNSGDVLLTFATDRSWQFQQSGDNASTRLQLKSNVDSKLFDICTTDGSITHSFFTSTADPTMTLTAYDADATEGPSINLTRNSASPAVNDLLGNIAFKGEDSASNETTFAKIQSVITDTTDGSEDGLLRLQATINGTVTTYYDAGYGANFFFKNVALHTGVNLSFEGSTNNNFETTVTVVDPTQDNTITLPDATGTINELLISSGSVSDVSSIDFNSSILTTEFSSYRLVLLNVKPVTDAVNFNMRVGTANSADGGTNYMQSNYLWGPFDNSGSTGTGAILINDHAQSSFFLAYSSGGLGTGTGENGHFEINLLNANSTSCYKHIRLNQAIYSYFPVAYGRRIDAAVYKSNSALNFITLFCSSGNIASADYRLYGVK